MEVVIPYSLTALHTRHAGVPMFPMVVSVLDSLDAVAAEYVWFHGDHLLLK